MSPRSLKIVALSYALKTLLLGAAWYLQPDLPDRARAAAQQTWAWLTGTETAPPAR